MAERKARERELLDKATRFMPAGSSGNTNFPESLKFLAREGRGSRIWDVSGNQYVDWLMGSGPMILGHSHPAVVAAVTEAVGQGSTFFTTNERAVLLAEKLVGRRPLRRPGALYHQRHRRLLSMYAGGPGLSPAGKRC